MADKKGNSSKDEKKGKPADSNDQLGENSGEGRAIKDNSKTGKCR